MLVCLKKDPPLPALFQVAGEEIAKRFGKGDVLVADKLHLKFLCCTEDLG